MKQKTAFKVLFFIYLAGVLFLCFGRFDNAPSVPSVLGIQVDKILHFLLFFPFPILAFLAFDKHTETVATSLIFTGISLAGGILLALATEFGQALTSWRSGDIWDFLADVTGLIVGSILVLYIDIRKQRR